MSTQASRVGSALDELAAGLEARFAEGVAASWADFDSVALRVFGFQFEHNSVYRRFCESRGRTPDTIDAWTEVPAVPATAFKHLDLVCGDPGDAELVFRTSGTTRGSERRGRHLVPRASLYRASLLPTFRERLLPDRERLRFVSLVPAATDVPDSSLSYMVSAAAEEFASEVAWVVDAAGAASGGALAAALDGARSVGEPVLLLGTAFAFVHALDAGLPIGPLPEGSRLMETGGFKGRARAVGREDLYLRLAEVAEVPPSRIVNEYGMTELLSQLYEPVMEGEEFGRGHVPPPWLRVRALDPTTLEEKPEGEQGILAFYDLANAGSVAHVLTEDLGRIEGGRVFLAGRVSGSEPRGCSRAMDELMSAAGSTHAGRDR